LQKFCNRNQRSFKKNSTLDFTIKEFPSYCGRPALSENELEENDDLVHLVLGGICLSKIQQQKNSNRIINSEPNCFYYFLNSELVDHYIMDGAYLITPSWLMNWRQHIEQWGFDQKTARDFFAESCKYLLLLDTGINPESENLLTEFGRFLSKEVKRIPIGLDFLRLKLLQILQENNTDYLKLNADFDQMKRKVSEYAMAFDLVGQLVQKMNEKEVLDKILMTMNILFSPGELHYLYFQKNQPTKLYSKSSQEVSDKKIWDELSCIQKQYQWLESECGFVISIKFKDSVLGILRIDKLAFPQHREHYLNLGLFLSNIFGLAITNARSFHLVQEQQKHLSENFDMLKDSETKLKVSSARLKMLNKIIRHDLSNDFAVIKSAVKLFSKTNNKIMLDEINIRVTKSLKAIANYREYESFIESNKKLKTVEISTLLKEVVTYFPKIDFQVEGKCTVFADGGLDSVFSNLISNSIRHGNATKIDIRISSVDNDCKITFSDNGSGIPDKIKDKVFDEGYTHDKSGNTGIGLFIVKTMINKYDGSIVIEDNKPNGATFIISLRKDIGE
jgi:signal transduction histidine kinase